MCLTASIDVKGGYPPPSLPLKDISLTLQPMEGNYPLRYNSICKEARTIKA